jgi:hypothetical protein
MDSQFCQASPPWLRTLCGRMSPCEGSHDNIGHGKRFSLVRAQLIKLTLHDPFRAVKSRGQEAEWVLEAEAGSSHPCF